MTEQLAPDPTTEQVEPQERVTILDLQVDDAVWINSTVLVDDDMWVDGPLSGVWLRSPDAYNPVLEKLAGLGYYIKPPGADRHVDGSLVIAEAHHPDPGSLHGLPQLARIIQPHVEEGS